MTGPRADLGQVLLQASQLALQDNSGPSLDVLDTGGTPAGSATAAQAAVSNGDSLILGPLTSAETASVAPIARGAGIPVLAFTNDASQSQPGVWPLGISADQQIQRLVTAAQAQGKTQIAGLLPDSDFGRAVAAALTKATQTSGLPPPNIRMHAAGMAAITATARDLSDYANRRGPIDAKVKAARALGTPEGRREAQELVKMPIPPPPFDVLLLADTGDNLQEIAAILPYYDVDRSAVQIIGQLSGLTQRAVRARSGALGMRRPTTPPEPTLSGTMPPNSARAHRRWPIWHLMRLLSPRWLSGLQGATWQSSRSPADLSEPTVGLSCRRTVKYDAG